MTEYKFEYQRDTFENKDNVMLLKEAAEELFSANEKDFEHIKSQNWYKRIWQMVTFSKDNEKVIAKNITSLAKAQDIVLKLLLSLSEENKELAIIINEISRKIFDLSNVTESIVKRVIDVENLLLYGHKKNVLIAGFSDSKKYIYLAALNFVADKYLDEENAEELARFLTAIRIMAKYNESIAEFNPQTFIFDYNESIAILPMLVEMNYICRREFILSDEISEIINCLNINMNDKKKIIAQVEADIRRIRVEGIIELYNSSNQELTIDEEDIDFEEPLFDEFIEEDNHPIELTEITISNILHIARGETKKFENNIIHINSYINCDGNLVFDNCEIYYNEYPDTPCQITLSHGSSLFIQNCKVVCNNLVENFLFKCDGTVSTRILDSVFENCSYMIEYSTSWSSENSFVMQECEIINPYIRFIELSHVDVFEICKTRITFNSSIVENQNNYYGYVFNVFNMGKENNSNISDVIVDGTNCYNIKNKDEGWGHDVRLFNIRNAIYKNCTFRNWNNCIVDAGTLSNCTFENVNYCVCNFKLLTLCKFIKCKNAINSGFNEGNKISHCTFINCESIIQADHCEIVFCQFMECINGLISNLYEGGINVNFCEFYNIKNTESQSWVNTAFLSFNYYRQKHILRSSVKKCIFNGVETNNAFLIEGSSNRKISGEVVSVEECSFQNCTTIRESGKIIKCYDTYNNFFNKQIQIKVTSIRDCLGLDKVNKENGYVKDVVVRAKDNTGLVIGAAVAGFVVGGPRGAAVASSLMNAFTKETDKVVE